MRARHGPSAVFALSLSLLAGCAEAPATRAGPAAATLAPAGTEASAREAPAARPDAGQPSEADIAALREAILAMGGGIAPDEAARAARIAYLYPLELAREYEIEDPPFLHNVKVLNGLKPRGTCWHFAEDLDARLSQERFETIALHRAIAEPLFRLDHAVVVVTPVGAPMRSGLVLDPWRDGFGRLHWVAVTEDRRYDWEERSVVRERRLARRGLAPDGTPLAR